MVGRMIYEAILIMNVCIAVLILIECIKNECFSLF